MKIKIEFVPARTLTALALATLIGVVPRLAIAAEAPPSPAGPVVEMPPPQTGTPALGLPRESPIENPLGRGPVLSGTAIGGYGELTLTAPSNASAVVDMRRLVLYVGHNFSDRIRFYSEIEVEHAIASSGDQGEIEIEQAYLDGLLGPRLNLRGGLILMPVGIINIYHEPPTFNGVDRPDVDTLIIPSTWREPGIGVFGELSEGLRYQAYIVNGFNANGFSAEAGVREGHQEAQLAHARDFGAVARVDYEPRLGTDVGLSGYLATAGNSLRPTVGSVPVGLVEADFRTRIQGFAARAEVAAAFIGDTAALNQALAAGDAEQMAAVPVSARLWGGYLEAGYDLLRLLLPGATQELTGFARYGYVNTQADVPAGFMARNDLVRHSVMAGLVYRPLPEIGLKADYQRRIPGEGAGFNVLSAAITWMF